MERTNPDETFRMLMEHFAGSRDNATNPAHLVLFAEIAAIGSPGVAVECVDFYLSFTPPTNQFLIRAHLCKARAMAALCSDEPEQLQKAVEFITTAVDIAKKSECYHFLVHNASVLLWQICRPYRGRSGWMGLCVSGWQSVVRAQEIIKEGDQLWRLDILLGLMESQVDAGLMEEGGKTFHSALQLARKKVPERLQEVLKLSVFHGLVVTKVMEKETKSLPESSVITKLYTLKQSISHLKSKEAEADLRKLAETVTSQPSKTPVPSNKTSLQFSSHDSRAAILLEIAQMCVEQDMMDLGEDCLAAVSSEESLESHLHLLKQIVKAQIDLRASTVEFPLYSQKSIRVRQDIITRLEDCLITAKRQGHLQLVEHVSVILWGICLPLLQPNLRSRLHNVLSTISSALTEIESVLYELRCVVHMELSKVLTDKNQIHAALDHINMACDMDRGNQWTEQLRRLERRLKLTSQLYHTPSSPLLQAAQLIEKVKSLNMGGSHEQLRAVLVKIGDLLAPTHFKIAIIGHSPQDSELTKLNINTIKTEKERKMRYGVSELLGEDDDSEYEGLMGEKEEGGTKDDMLGKTENMIKMKFYELVKEQAEAHRVKVGSTDDRDRCMLWADLAKFARKCNVWDVAFISSKFCAIYDDNRWKAQASNTSVQPSKSSTSKTKKSSSMSMSRSRSDVSTRSSMLGVSNLASGPNSLEREAGRRRGEEMITKDLLRAIAEAHFIYAECAVYQLKQSGYQLGDGLPLSALHETPEPNDTLAWSWPGSLSLEAYSSFLRAGELGCNLQESWLVANAATYIYNYSHHMLESGNVSELVTVFRRLNAQLATARQYQTQEHGLIGVEVVCRVSTVLARGLVQKWTPSPPDPTTVEPLKEKPGSRKSGKRKGGGVECQLQVSPDSGPELQEALSVCDDALKLSGHLTLGVRAPLLAVWVRCRQLLHEPISIKTLGVAGGEGDPNGGRCRALVAMEMLSLKENRIWEFPDSPSLGDALELVRSCTWNEEDKVLKLQLLVRTARLAFLHKNYTLVQYCAKEATIRTGDGGEHVTIDGKEQREEKYSQQEKELLSTITSLQGQAIMAEKGEMLVSHRAALKSFLQSARYGKEAGSYRMTMDAGRRSWNTMCLKLMVTTRNRVSQHGLLTELLSILTSLFHSHQDVAEEDLQVLVALYCALFQIYIDKEKWMAGMNAVEEAFWNIPRTVHQCFAEYKMVFKSRLGKDVTSDILRLQDITDEERARLWYKVACNSSNPQLQLTGFQNAITALNSKRHVLVKVDILISLSEWLYSHQYPVEDAVNHLKLALSILLPPPTREGQEKEVTEGEVKDAEEEEVEGNRSEPSVSTREKAIQILLIITKLQGRENTSHKETCLAALAHCHLIWKDTLGLVSDSLSGKSSLTVPSSISGWIDFSLIDELKEYIKSSDSEYSVNPKTIPRPGLTSHYLGMLSDELCASGLHGLALPVEILRLLVVDCLLQSRATSQLIHLRLGSMCGALGAVKVSEEHRVLSGPPYLNAEDMARSQVEMKQWQQKQDIVMSSIPISTDSNMEDTITLRKVWAEEATMLIEQGLWDDARELLHEAQKSSEVFGDGETMGRILLAWASLAAAERRVNDCINCVCQASKYPLGLEDWSRGIDILLMLAASENNFSLLKNISKTISETVNSLKLVIGKKNRNEKERLGFTEVIVRARLMSLKIMIILNTTDNEECDLEELYEEMPCLVEDLFKLKRGGMAAEIFLRYAKVLTRCSATKDKKDTLLEAIKLAKRAVDVFQSMVKETLTLCPMSDGLYVRDEILLAEAKLALADILLCVSEKYLEEEKCELSKLQLKTSVEQMIDEYVRVRPPEGSAEDVWNKVASVASERVFDILEALLATDVVQSQAKLKTQCMYRSGKALMMMAQQRKLDTLSPWTVIVEDDNSGETVMADCKVDEREVETGGESTIAPKESHKVTESESHNQGLQYMKQAMELALQSGDTETAARVALTVADSVGSRDPKATALNLSVYQSCVASQYLLQLLHKVVSDPSETKLGALIHQHHKLTHSSTSSPPPLLDNVSQQLDTYSCWQRLAVSDGYSKLLKQFPSHFRFILLQHSPDKSLLYTAYLVPPQPPPATKKGQPPPITVSEVPVVARVAVSSEERRELIDLVESCHRLQAQQLLRNTPLNECVMKQEFTNITNKMNDYISPVLKSVSHAIRMERNDEGLTVVLLADIDLLRLPLEALNLLKLDCIKAVARDFSLQMHYHRIKKYIVEEEATGKREKFLLQPPSVQANTTSFKYILDPRCELFDGADQIPSEIVSSKLELFSKLTSKWTGHKGITVENAMSSSQWHPILNQCSGLIYLGSERLLAHFPAKQFISLSLKECGIAIIMDRMQTLRSSLVQSKLDLLKSEGEIEVERSVETAILLSLIGIDSFVLRQWHSPVQNTTNDMCTLLNGLLSEGVCVANLKWSDIEQLNTKSDIEELPSESNHAQKDHSALFNSVVYGLPHFTLLPQ